VQFVSNVLMTAYSATYNEFYICNWYVLIKLIGSADCVFRTIPRSDQYRFVCNTVVSSNPKLTCGANYTIGVTYANDVLSVRTK
jgi:hypothetical protein